MTEPEPDSTASFDAERYWSERLEGQFSLAGVGWLGLSEAFNRWMYAVRTRVFRRALRNRLDLSQASVLDVGSGTGFYVALWKRLGAAEVTGSDLTGVVVERLRERFPDSAFHQLDIAATPLPSLPKFDAISAMDMLFHIVDDAGYAQALHNLSDLLVPGGRLVFTENFLHGDTVRGAHQVSRSLEEIETLLRRTGLEIELRRPLFVLMNTPIDSDSPILRWTWPCVHLLARTNISGWLVGATLYPLELALTRILREGPTTELVVCHKARVVEVDLPQL